MPVSFQNIIEVKKVIHINVPNEVRRLWFGDALLFALILESCLFEKKIVFFWRKSILEAIDFLL